MPMQKILDYFQQITQIPHCSHNTNKLKDFLADFAKKRDYEVDIDEAQNILIRRGTSKLALQAHYDMVCVGIAPKIEIYIKDGWMMAKNSTLGADNGISIAIMMALMDEGKECEFLFTSDEEVGLIGASNLEFKLDAKNMLNLDSEDDAKVYIGCAGGIDIEATKEYVLQEQSGDFYEITIGGLSGGHSGVDIDKNIQNAIKLFGDFLKDKDVYISSLEAGERINSIPVNLKAILFSQCELICEKNINIVKIDEKFKVVKNRDILLMIDKFKNGVLSFNTKFQIPNDSINLALISLKNGNLKIEVSIRSMNDISLQDIEKKYIEFFENFGCTVKSEGKYPAWKPEINSFSKEVEKSMIEVFGKSEFKAIHAGLECAIISEKYPDIKFTSIGPNICFPHSLMEKVELKSVEKIYEVIKKVVNSYEK
jgi:dipeptidase D